MWAVLQVLHLDKTLRLIWFSQPHSQVALGDVHVHVDAEVLQKESIHPSLH